ncbi:MAG: DUF1592 domain-containing protein [Acidobacteria bacterium]|nr:DUF1592 domain-containing protein [Acidobacteriota bacterium]
MQYIWVRGVLPLLLVAGVGVAGAQGPGVTGRVAPASVPIPMTETIVAGVLDQYCVTCHNERVVAGAGTAPSPLVAQLRTVGLALDTLDLSEVGTHGDVWESVVRKLRVGAMPPTGRPRPDAATLDAVAEWLEGALDRAAAAAPDPGRRPALHRLSRTEYQYAVRDLLALDNLPKELDIAVMLPADNATSGFDNLADLLFVSPTLMERYLAAARKISRLAVGDPTMLPIVDTYPLDGDLVQDRHVPGLPLGTRGGTRVQSHLPLDGEYVITVQFNGAAREAHDGEISVDGERVHLFTVGLAPPKPTASGVFTFDDDPDVDVRIPLRAGPRDVAVSFIPKSGALLEGPVRAHQSRSRQPSIASVIISGPYGADGAGDTPSRRQIFRCRPGDGASQAETATCARTILSSLARRAYRRPVTEDDLGRLLEFYEKGLVEGGFERGIQRAIERVLVSPEFLFRIERNPDGVVAGAPHPVSDLELASRLSFFLWSSIPDDTLLDVAARGELRDPSVLDREVRRLMADPRSSALVTNFAEQWLFLRDVDTKEPDAGFFPGFDENLRQAFRTETALFVDSVLRDDRSVLDLLTANHTFVNERLAKHYGIPHVYGSHFRRVELEDSRRRGLLGQGSILTLTSYGTRTSPVLRGKWILENLLSSPPPPPPPDIPALSETTEDGKPRSMREAMEVHRANPACASCHSQMDPLGFALENFDAIGRWRDRGESNLPIDASGLLPNGTLFDGPSGLRAELVKSPEQFVTTMTEKLLTYALGRGVEHFDAPTIRAIVRDAAQDDYRFASVVSGIVNSTPFQMRKAE